MRLTEPLSGQVRWVGTLGGFLALLLTAVGPLSAREEPLRPQFKYAGGTESLSDGCEGNLEINPEALTFKCRGGAISVPYSSISLMQYRSGVSDRVHRMRVKWKVRPTEPVPILGAKQNRYFTVVYRLGGKPHIMVLRVRPQAMRPYLAELELRSEKRVEVESYEEY